MDKKAVNVRLTILSLLVENPKGLTSEVIIKEIKDEFKIDDKEYVAKIIEIMENDGFVTKNKDSYIVTDSGIDHIHANQHIPPPDQK